MFLPVNKVKLHKQRLTTLLKHRQKLLQQGAFSLARINVIDTQLLNHLYTLSDLKSDAPTDYFAGQNLTQVSELSWQGLCELSLNNSEHIDIYRLVACDLCNTPIADITAHFNELRSTEQLAHFTLLQHNVKHWQLSDLKALRTSVMEGKEQPPAIVKTLLFSQPLTSSELLAAVLHEYKEGTVLFIKLRFAAGFAGVLTSSLLIWDAYDLNKKGQHGAALASLIGSGLGIASALHGAVFVSMGPFGWAFLIGSIVSGLIVSYLTLTDAETWAKYGPFSKDSSQRIQLDKQSSKATVPANNKYEPFADPKLYMRFITSVLFSPQVVIKHLQGTHYVIEINLPLYNNHNSDVYLNVGLKRFARGAQSLNVDIKPINVPKNGQPILSQTKWGVKEIASLQPLQFQRNDNGQITKAVSFGMFDDNYVFNVSAKARVDIEGVSYPQKLISYKTIDEEKANPEDATDWQSAVLHL
ncbi:MULTISPECIES: hypothetical protein [unclassified Pseudoalteromonas]|uniref:hypothetical protein n=1 Tax=unclassified Pseudoalteromonas TaxID=194690 RepID=UPI0025B4BC71|nr:MULTISPECIES: hypothetical protein [unclassified Pseudoalteromonas]MDN3380899.1 hypothetical protein [Pseudoalteromonas sp. APC 3893]MDN3389306.1 hypothetical protein [Pseudoalteromonas sp. APC 4017]